MTPKKRFTFVGVTTGSSLIMRVFPRWAEYLGLRDVEMAGVDLPIHAEPSRYREVASAMKGDPLDLGALVTTHKIDMFHACRDLFDYADPYAELCGEVSCLSKRDGSFQAHAKDPISAGQSLDDILGSAYWGKTGGHVLCLGAGGSAIAISLHLMTRKDAADRPGRMVLVNRSQDRLDAIRSIHEKVGSDVEFEYVLNENPEANDGLMGALPEGSLVINATGMGKDSPGSPVTDRGFFPENGVVWELNYRGELDFLHQARRQEEARNLAVHDGWRYFIYGWTAVMEQVFDVELSGEQLGRLAEIAEETRAVAKR